jgi:hypothetical protein
MARRPKPDPDLIEYLDDHLKYERNMLRFTFDMLFKSGEKRWCAFFESFGVHARNLYIFLRNSADYRSYVRADDYVPGHCTKSNFSRVDEKMNSSFFHLSTSRLKNKPVTLKDAIEIGEWIDREWATWAVQLRDPFKLLVDISPSCTRPISDASSPSGTNQPRSF